MFSTHPDPWKGFRNFVDMSNDVMAKNGRVTTGYMTKTFQQFYAHLEASFI
jgi:hypothetical protein